MFTFPATINFLVAVVVGGLSLVEGPILGAAFSVLVSQIFSEFTGIPHIVYGVAIILGIYFRTVGTCIYFRGI